MTFRLIFWVCRNFTSLRHVRTSLARYIVNMVIVQPKSVWEINFSCKWMYVTTSMYNDKKKIIPHRGQEFSTINESIGFNRLRVKVTMCSIYSTFLQSLLQNCNFLSKEKTYMSFMCINRHPMINPDCVVDWEDIGWKCHVFQSNWITLR